MGCTSISRKGKKIHYIIQVAFLRRKIDSKNLTLIQNGERSIPFPIEVWDHFSKIDNIKRLESPPKLNIIVWPDIFHNRLNYRHKLVSYICEKFKQNNNKRIIVFLDPDTGIQPGKGSNLKYITQEDIKEIYRILELGDLLVIYQHAGRTKNWLDKSKNIMAIACNNADINHIMAKDIAKDVAILWCLRKEESNCPNQKQSVGAIITPIKSMKKTKDSGTCACQCGNSIKKGRYFSQWHDAKLKSKFLNIRKGRIDKKDQKKNIQKMYEISLLSGTLIE
jgi:hypothetical protein